MARQGRSVLAPAGQPWVSRRRRYRRRRLLLLAVPVLLVALVVLAGGSIYSVAAAVLAQAHGNLDPLAVQALARTSAAAPGASAVPAPPTDAVTILVLGSDKLPDEQQEYGRSDSIMLLRVDPTARSAALLSLPRDLRVAIPGHDTQKLNAAYALGGDPLAIETIHELTGLTLDYYVNLDFDAFLGLVAALDGVYLDIDHRYLSTSPDRPPIDLQPGYQQLNAEQALQYVRFRYDLNADFGRMARQQRFLRAVREQLTGVDILTAIPSLLTTLATHAGTNIGTTEAFRLAYWGVQLGTERTTQVHIAGLRDETIDGASYLVASDEAIREAVRQLITPPDADPASAPGTDAASPPLTTTPLSTTPDPQSAASPATAIPTAERRREMRTITGLPLLTPTYLPADYRCVQARTYTLGVAPGLPTVRLVYQHGEEDQYLGVTQTAFVTAPAASPGEEVDRNGTTYTVVASGRAVERIWWIGNGTLYWVSNTLGYLESREELLRMASSCVAAAE